MRTKSKTVVTQESPGSNAEASDYSSNDQSNDNQSQIQSRSRSESESDQDDLSIDTLNPKIPEGEIHYDVQSVFKEYTFDEMIAFLKRTFPMDPHTGDILPISEKRNVYVRKVVGHLQLRSDSFRDDNIRDVMQSWLKKISQAGIWEKKIKREILKKREGHAERERVGECVKGDRERDTESESESEIVWDRERERKRKGKIGGVCKGKKRGGK